MNDVDLITKVKNNDKQAFKVLFNTYKTNVYRTAFLILKDYQYADDVVQDTFMQVYLKINKLTNPFAFEKWLYKIAINLCFEIIRKNGKYKRIALDEEVDKEIIEWNGNVPLPENIAIQKETQRIILECIYSLQVNHRTVLVLFYFNSFSVKEISDIMECSEGTVKSRLFYAKRLLKDTLISKHNDIISENLGGIFYGY